MPVITSAHAAVLALLIGCPRMSTRMPSWWSWWAELLGVPEAEEARRLEELEAAGCVTSATGPLQ